MSALPKIPLITIRPLARPAYDVSACALYDLASFVHANAAALERWYDQVRAGDPAGMCSREEFYAVQYDRERLLRDQHEHEARDERRFRFWEDRAANDAGVPRWGEL